MKVQIRQYRRELPPVTPPAAASPLSRLLTRKIIGQPGIASRTPESGAAYTSALSPSIRSTLACSYGARGSAPDSSRRSFCPPGGHTAAHQDRLQRTDVAKLKDRDAQATKLFDRGSRSSNAGQLRQRERPGPRWNPAQVQPLCACTPCRRLHIRSVTIGASANRGEGNTAPLRARPLRSSIAGLAGGSGIPQLWFASLQLPLGFCFLGVLRKFVLHISALIYTPFLW